MRKGEEEQTDQAMVESRSATRENNEGEDAKNQLSSNQGSYLSPESDGTLATTSSDSCSAEAGNGSTVAGTGSMV